MTTPPRTSAREVRRENDWAPDDSGELVGLLLPADGGDWVPATVFGAALGPATDEALAESLVRERGLSSLAERWLLFIPPPCSARPMMQAIFDEPTSRAATIPLRA